MIPALRQMAAALLLLASAAVSVASVLALVGR